jgi:hypothetical protein
MTRGSLWPAVGMSTLVGLIVLGVPEPGQDQGSEGPRLVMIPSGTTVDGRLPSEWTERVIRSVPRLASGEIETLPASGRKSATLFRTIILAQVAGKTGAYRLQSLGLGNAVPFKGHEVVVTPEGPPDVRRSFSAVEKLVAGVAYKELTRARIVCRTPTFALLRTPSRLVVGGAHAEVELYYAVLVEPGTGRLMTLNFSVRSGVAAIPPRITRLTRDQTFDCGLDVAVDGKLGPVNLSWSFAMAAPPPGRMIVVPPSMARAAEAPLEGRSDAAGLEADLRGLLSAVPAR